MEDAFKMYNKYGVKNIKTGYVNDVSKNIKVYGENGEISKEWHHGQYMVNHFQKVIDIAAKYKLMIKTHEPIKDTGLRRTFPNFISREGAKGQSLMVFFKRSESCYRPSFHQAFEWSDGLYSWYFSIK